MTIVGYPSIDTSWAQWHTRCSALLKSPDKQPDPSAQHALGEAPHQLPGLPGTWWVVQDRVFIAAKPGDRLEYEGERIGGIEILDLVDGAPGLLLRHDDRTLEVTHRAGRISVRVYALAD